MERENHARQIPAGEIAVFCEQLAMLLHSGAPLYMGMEAVGKSYMGKSAQQIGELCRAVMDGEALPDALRAQGVWPSYMLEMVAIGDAAGRLESVAEKLAAHYRREDELKSAAKSALAYPLVLSAMVVGILLVMLLKVLPVFREMLGSMGMSAAQVGEGMMHWGSIIGAAMLVLMLMSFIAVPVLALLLRSRHRQATMSLLGRLFRPLGSMCAHRSAARVASVLSMLLYSGVSLSEFFRRMPELIEDSCAKEKLRSMAERISRGEGVGAAIADTGLFDDMSACLIRTSAELGELDETMEKLAAEYEQKTESSLERIASGIEPALVGLLALVIGGVLLSLMLPMGGIISGML